jgi:ParB family chromosome partitioning protein
VPSKLRLGKGLDALLPRGETPAVSAETGEITLPLDKLIANPAQPRKHFDEAELLELADSIKEHGVIQPIIAEDAGNGTYIIVAGERRSRAARMAGLTEVPALIRNYSDEKRMEVSLIENVQRADLNPVEEAAAYRQLMDLTGRSQDEVAARVGKNRSTVANALRLLKLPPPMLEALGAGKISPGHGRALLSAAPGEGQETLFREILDGGISVREAEKRAALLNGAGGGQRSTGEPEAAPGGLERGQSPEGQSLENPAPPRPARDPELRAMEQRFIETLGTKVAIQGDLKRGSIHIDYYSMEDLDRLYGLLGGNKPL